jgi:hypothetical protein
MKRGMTDSSRVASCLLAALALAGFAAAACSEIHPEANSEEAGVLESPTHQADSLHRAEKRREQDSGGGGGGGGY